MSFQSLGSFSVTFAGGVSLDAASATLPYVVVRPVGVWVMTPLATLQSVAGTPQPSAAACIEHDARGGAALADVLVRLADAAAAAGGERAPHALAGDALAGRRVFGA